MTIIFTLNQYIFLFLSFEPTLFVVQLILAQFSNMLSTNSLYWASWAWVYSRNSWSAQTQSLQVEYKIS